MVNRTRIARQAIFMVPFLVLATCAVSRAAGPYYVATNGLPGSGTNWAQAFTNIQQALDIAADNEEIRLAGHTFGVTNELRWANKTNVLIRGGWQGVGAPGPNDPATWPTVVQRASGVTNRLLRIGSVTGVVEGVTFQGGLVLSAPYQGGGVLASNSILTFKDCTIRANSVQGAGTILTLKGGGLYAMNCGLLFTNCTIAGNNVMSLNQQNASWGGGCMFEGGTVEVADTLVSNNLVKGKGATAAGTQDRAYGGGVAATAPVTVRNSRFIGNIISGTSGSADKTYAYGAGLYAGSALTVIGSVINGNRVSGSIVIGSYGGGIYSQGPLSVRDTVLRDNTLDDSNSIERGGGIYASLNAVDLVNLKIVFNAGMAGDGLYLSGCTSANVVNCLVANNDGQGLRNDLCTALAVSNSIFWANGDDLVGFATNASGVMTNVWYCDIEDGDNADVQGCFSADPQFERGYYLAESSPCVNTGGTTSISLGLDARTTRADDTLDTNTVDLGYHYAGGVNPAVRDLYVLGSGLDGDTGADWDHAFRSISHAISVAEDGTHVHIGEGLYTNGLESFPLVVKGEGISLMGTNAATCIVNAAGATQRALSVLETLNTRIRGLTLANGLVPYSGSWAWVGGGGVMFSNAVATLDSCIVASNAVTINGHWGSVHGGGVCVAGRSSVDVTNCIIAGNQSRSGGYNAHAYGGGCSLLEGQCRITDSILMNNAVVSTAPDGYSAFGGGIYTVVPLTVERSVLARNGVYTNSPVCRGGAIYAAANLTLRQVLVANNNSFQDFGDGLYMGGGTLTATNVTFAGNSGQGVCLGVPGTVFVGNSIFQGNGDDLVNVPTDGEGVMTNVWYCDIEDGDNNGKQGCVSEDALFVDSIYYHLQSRQGNYVGGYFSGGSWSSDLQDSPGIDAGDPASDWSREPYPHGRTANMGAYGNTAVASKTLIRGTLMYFR